LPVEIPFRQVRLLRERRARLPGPIHTVLLSMTAARLPFSQAHRSCRDVLRLRHFVLHVPIVFPSVPDPRSATAHPTGFASVSVARRRMNRAPPIYSLLIDRHPMPRLPERNP